mgnify:FL=1
MKKLVAFYSRADENYFDASYRYIEVGNSENVARMIAGIKGADMFRIEQKIPYAADYSTATAQAKKDRQENLRPELKALPDLSGYDEIYLGYPNYWGTMPMAVYTFLDSSNFEGKVIHPFCTHEGSGLSGTESDIANEVPAATVTKGLAIKGSLADEATDSVERWV